jgi:DNA polymerase-3 subunit delta'
VSTQAEPWTDVIGQESAVATLRNAAADPVHAYLFVGPSGSGKRQAARSFAAEVLSGDAAEADADRHVRLALSGIHPDLVLVEPAGRSLRGEEADRLTMEGWRSPIEASRKVIVCDRFDTAEPGAAASLLKTLEEPPATTIFVLLAEEIPPEHITIASRCVTVEFHPVPDEIVVESLVDQGLDEAMAKDVAIAAGGDTHRAQLLAGDPQLRARLDAWRSVPDRLDGNGASVAVAVTELREMIDAAQAPLDERQEGEMTALQEQEEQLGTRGSGRREIEARHKREQRLLRDAELRAGFATLARVYRDRLESGGGPRDVAAIALLRDATEALLRNPNEALLLQGLFVNLGR